MAIKSTVGLQWRGTEVKIQGKKVVNKSAYEIGLVVEGYAKELAARRFGYLAASITTQSFDKGTELEAPAKYKTTDEERSRFDENMARKNFKKIAKPNDDTEVLVGTALDYAAYVELGTIKMDSQPYLRPALDLARGKALTIVKEKSKYYFGDYLRRPEDFQVTEEFMI